MTRSSLDTNVIHVLTASIKFLVVAAVLGSVYYVVQDVYYHVKSIDAECTTKVETEVRQAWDLLGGFCRSHPNDVNGICTRAHDTVHLHDAAHAIRDCRTAQMLDHPFFSSDSLRALVTYTTQGVVALVILVFVILWLLKQLGVSVMEVRKVTADYNHSKTAELPTVVAAKPFAGPSTLVNVPPPYGKEKGL